MSASPKSLLDLSTYLNEVKDREAGVVIAADGQILASDIDSSATKAGWIEEIHELVKKTSSLLENSNISGLERGLIEGSKRKLVIQRNPRLGFFVVIIGLEPMNIGLAGLTAKNISAVVEATLGSRP